MKGKKANYKRREYNTPKQVKVRQFKEGIASLMLAFDKEIDAIDGSGYKHVNTQE